MTTRAVRGAEGAFSVHFLAAVVGRLAPVTDERDPAFWARQSHFGPGQSRVMLWTRRQVGRTAGSAFERMFAIGADRPGEVFQWSSLRLLGPEAAANLADGLTQPLLVFDQGEPEETFTGLAEPSARADRNSALLEQLEGEIDRAHR